MATADELLAWTTGTPTGGPNGDGRYPLTYTDGVVYLVYCPAAQALNPSLDEQPIEVFANTAQAAATTATTQAGLASQARIDAQAFAANAAQSATDAETAETNAVFQATLAQGAATQSDISAVAAANAAGAAQEARDKAQAWANTAVDTAVEPGLYSALHWAQKAADSAGSVSMGNFYTKVESDGRYSVLAHNHDTAYAAAVHTHNYLAPGGAFADAFSTATVYYNGTTSIIDCNLLATGTKALVASTGNTNVPATPGVSFWYIETIQSFNTADATRIQRAYSYDAPNAKAFRCLQSGTWSAWTYEWNTGNFDPTSKVNVTQVLSGYGDPNTIGGTLSHTAVTSPKGNAPEVYTTIWNFGSSGNRDGQLAWQYGDNSTDFWLRSRHDLSGDWNAWVKLCTADTVQTITAAKAFSAQVTASAGIAVNASIDGGGAQGIRHWVNTDPNWQTYMGQAGAGKSASGGTASASLSGRTGYHLRHRFSNNTAGPSQGVIWENGSEVVMMSLDADLGRLWVKANVISVNGHFNAAGSAAVVSCESAGLGIYFRPTQSGSDLYAARVTADGYLMGYDGAGTGRAMLQYGDAWLRLNPSGQFTSGIYTANSLVRHDGALQVGSTSTNGFYCTATVRPKWANSNLVVNNGGVDNIQKMTQAAYNALGTKDANTLYIIVG